MHLGVSVEDTVKNDYICQVYIKNGNVYVCVRFKYVFILFPQSDTHNTDRADSCGYRFDLGSKGLDTVLDTDK